MNSVIGEILLSQKKREPEYKLKALMDAYGAQSPNELFREDIPIQTQEEAARLLKLSANVEMPRYGPQNVSSMGVSQPGFVVNQPGQGNLIPPPSTEIDFNRQIKSKMVDMYIPDKQSEINVRIANINADEAKRQQEKMSGEYQGAVSELQKTKGEEAITGKDLQGINEKFPLLHPNTRMETLRSSGIDPLKVGENDKYRLALSNIQNGLKNGTNVFDLKWISKNVMPNVAPEKGLSMMEKFMPQATKETMNDYQLNLIKEYVARKPMSKEKQTILINTLHAMNPSIMGMMDYYDMTHMSEYMDKDPNIRNSANEVRSEYLRNLIITSIPGINDKEGTNKLNKPKETDPLGLFP